MVCPFLHLQGTQHITPSMNPGQNTQFHYVGFWVLNTQWHRLHRLTYRKYNNYINIHLKSLGHLEPVKRHHQTNGRQRWGVCTYGLVQLGELCHRDLWWQVATVVELLVLESLLSIILTLLHLSFYSNHNCPQNSKCWILLILLRLPDSSCRNTFPRRLLKNEMKAQLKDCTAEVSAEHCQELPWHSSTVQTLHCSQQ